MRAVAERRLPLAVEDDAGNRRQGEVVIVPSWRPDLELNATADFTIVLSTKPLDGACPSLATPDVVVCAPSAPVRLPKAVAEAAVAYDAGSNSVSLRLPQRALDAFASGSIVAARPLAVTAHDVFGNGSREPRLRLLALQVVNGAGQRDRYWRVLDEVLSRPRPPARLPRAAQIRTRLRRLLEASPDGEAVGQTGARDSIERLRAIAGGAAPDEVAAGPRLLAEDVAFARCLPEQRAAALELAAMREYVGAAGEDATGDLATDAALALEQLSFTTLLDAPHQLGGLRGAFEVFRDRYTRAYTTHHDRYWRARSRLGASLQEAATAARALAGLNTLRGLGAPVGVAALEQYERLTSGRERCDATGIATALRERPRCPECGLAIGDAPPADETEETLRRLRAALARQQSRLAAEAVRRILARGGERLEQFIQIVQAADIAGLAKVIDDDLLDFLRELLAQPVTPTREALDLVEELARAHPEIGPDDVDAAAETLRRLLRERVATGGPPLHIAGEAPPEP